MNIKRLIGNTIGHNTILRAKKLWYANHGETIRYGEDNVHYIPGARPVRMNSVKSSHITVKNVESLIQMPIYE